MAVSYRLVHVIMNCSLTARKLNKVQNRSSQRNIYTAVGSHSMLCERYSNDSFYTEYFRIGVEKYDGYAESSFHELLTRQYVHT
jgi:hypothetical protein